MVSVSLFLLALPQLAALAVNAHVPVRHICNSRVRSSAITARASDKVKLALDIKGKPIWDLRKASADDVVKISQLAGSKMWPSDVVSSLVSGGMCVVGESGDTLVSCALVHTYNGLKKPAEGMAGGLEKCAELLTVLDASGVPDDIREKTALGALRLLKTEGFAEVTCSIATDDKENKAFVDKLKLQPAASDNKAVLQYAANLLSMNPDPQKKMKNA